MRARWVEHHIRLLLTRRLKVKERWKTARTMTASVEMLSHTWADALPDSPSLPEWGSSTVPRNNRMYYFFISTLLMQFASHKWSAPPAAEGLYPKHKYNVMGENSLLSGYTPSPGGFWGLCDLATGAGFRVSAQASQPNGSGYESRLHHLLTVGPQLRPQSPGFLM